EEVGGALVSIALVLCAVFVPTAFLGGISGQFFQQFAITIAVATAISCFCSLTLSPALASQILQPHEDKRPPASWNFIARGWDKFTGYFNRGFDRLSRGYAKAADFVIRHSAVMLLLYVALITTDLRKRLSAIQGAFIIVIPPPPVPGIGTGGGFTMRVQDRQGRGPELLAAANDELVAAARKAPGLTQVFSPFTANTPQLF